MKKTLLFVLTFLLTTSISFTQDANQQGRPAVMKQFSASDIETMTDNLLNKYIDKDLFSGAVLISKDKEIVYYKSFGKSDYETGRENKTDTKFDIGSINKDYTAVAILQLCEKGLLNLEDNIGKYLNIFPEEVLEKVTIRQLLTHTSGFGDYFMIPGVIPQLSELTTVNKIINKFKDEPLLFEPGTDKQYSNAGFAVLGAVIERVSGLSYFEYIKRNILEPADLKNTYFDYKQIRADKDIPAGYMFSSTGTKQRIDYEKSPSPAGSAFSTAEDLLKFQLSLLYDNKILGDKMKILFANDYMNSESESWNDILSDSGYIAAYAGGAPGRNSVVYSQPASGYVIVVLSNYDEPSAENVGRDIYRMLAGKEVDLPEVRIFQKLYNAYRENGSAYLKENFFKITAGEPDNMEKDFLLNRIGYDLLNEQKIKEAIEVFKVNSELYPEIGNTYDSLGEAYLKSGNKKLALENYKKAFKLDPENRNSEKIIEELSKE